MKNFNRLFTVSAFLVCSFSCHAVRAQTTISYATVDYDEATNTIYGYTYTEPDYSGIVYYNKAHVTAKLRDASDNQLAIGTAERSGGRAELFLQASGNGNPPYKIQSGHMVYQTYYVYNYYDPRYYQQRSGWLDYYYYSYYSRWDGPGYPVINIPLYFTFHPHRPETVTSNPNMLLGQLLSLLFNGPGEVVFEKADFFDVSGTFDGAQFPTTTIKAYESSRAQGMCTEDGPYHTLDVYFKLADNSSTLASNRCTARPLGNLPDWDVNEASVRCVIDDSFNKKGHLSVSVSRGAGPGIDKPKISVGIGCNKSGGGICDGKATVKIICQQS